MFEIKNKPQTMLILESIQEASSNCHVRSKFSNVEHQNEVTMIEKQNCVCCKSNTIECRDRKISFASPKNMYFLTRRYQCQGTSII